MTVRPFVQCELKAACRRASFYWGRAGFAFVASLLAVVIVAYANSKGGSLAGARSMLNGLSFVLFLYCLYAGIKATSDSISRERREETLGLLFLTPIRGADIVLGKLVAGGIMPLHHLLAVAPVIALFFLLGGAGWDQTLRLGAGLLVTLFFGLALGVGQSAFSRSQKRIHTSLLGYVILFWWLLPAVGQAVQRAYPGALPGLLIEWSSPAYLQSLALSPTRGGPADFYWSSLLWIQCVAWLPLGAAIFWVPRCWRERNAASGKRSWSERLDQWKYGMAPIRRRHRRRLLAINPFLWLVSRTWHKSYSNSVFLAAGTLVVGFFAWMAPAPLEERLQWTLLISFALGYLFLKLRLADEAGRELSAQRAHGGLEMVLATSLSVPEMIKGQWLALREQFRGPIVVLLLMGGVLLLMAIFQPGFAASLLLSKLEGIILLAGLMIVFVADSVALGWVGMWLALKMKQPKQVASGAVARVIMLPALLFFFLLTCAQFWGPLSWMDALNFGGKFALWVGLGLAIDLAFAVHSRRRLYRQFRNYATLHYLSSKP